MPGLTEVIDQLKRKTCTQDLTNGFTNLLLDTLSAPGFCREFTEGRVDCGDPPIRCNGKYIHLEHPFIIVGTSVLQGSTSRQTVAAQAGPRLSVPVHHR